MPVHEFEFAVGIGYDDNPYLAPDKPYYDQNRREVIAPQRESGLMLPIDLDGELRRPLGAGGYSFLTEYRLRGDFYPDAATSNADEAYARVEPGVVFDLAGESRRDRVVELRALASYNKELYFDRDTGLPAATAGTDISDRYEYAAFGGEVAVDYELSRVVEFLLETSIESRDYTDPGIVDRLDHDRYRGRAGLELRLARSARLDLDYRLERQDYDERRARSLDGDDALGNPTLEYTYQRLSSDLRLRPSRPLTLELSWTHTTRTDEFEHYNDYDQDSLRLRARLLSKFMEWRLQAEYWERDFENAFIFDKPVNPGTGEPNPNKAYETVELELAVRFEWGEHRRPFVAVDYTDQQAVDPRFDYRRSRFMAGLEFVY